MTAQPDEGLPGLADPSLAPPEPETAPQTEPAAQDTEAEAAPPGTGDASATQPVPPDQAGFESEPGSSFTDQHEEAAPQFGAVRSASNAPTVLPASAQASAARAHLVIGRMVSALQAVQADLEKYIPPGMLQAAEGEALVLLRGVL
jgi:hypothetical protein